MKTEIFSKLPVSLRVLFLLVTCLLPMGLAAQTTAAPNDPEEGIVVYSDTSGVTTNSDYVQPDTSALSQTDSMQTAVNLWDTLFSQDQDADSGEDGFFQSGHPLIYLFQHMLGISLILGIILIILFIGIPLLIIIGLIYLILKMTRPVVPVARPGEPPLTPEEIENLKKQQTIRLASVGVALLLVEWFFGMAHIAGIVGIVLLCIAGGQWLGRKR